MRNIFFRFFVILCLVPQIWAQKTYNDATGDIDPGIATGGGTLDLVKMEVSNTSTDILFKLTVNGNLTTTDWGKFMMGISTGSTASTNTGNGWGRPINLNSDLGGMDYWIGTWVDGGGGGQLWNYTGGGWAGPTAPSGYTFSGSTINITVTAASLGLNAGDLLYFDAYSSGGGGSDGAVDALAKPTVSIVGWGDSYTSNATNGIFSYKFAGITLTDGSSYTYEVTPGSTNQPIGRFALTDFNAGSSLTDVNIRLNGVRTGASNFKLWASTDNTFNSGTDTQIGLTTALDPGNGGSVGFLTISRALSSSATYFFLTCDLTAGATGMIQADLIDNSALLFSGGSLATTISSTALSGGSIPLPVELVSFNASCDHGNVDLTWQTATEVNNNGFEVERKISTSDWYKIGFVEGNGTSNSPKFYSFSDKPTGTGKISYRLKQIDNDGMFEYSPTVEVLVDNLPNGFVLEQNYPNPFNPETSIRFALREDTKATLKVYNSLGSEIATLFDGTAEAGRYYDVKFGSGELASGFYIYKLVAGEYVSVKKMLLMK
ncbi:MAG: T9SS type A sorting domain-containing protein [Ignavibacteria bacterium]|nr:T9SS type A sorting domain-containing protein [Ignavibacteria bacterium]